MPTGSGKSLTYQLAAMLRPDPTLVLSPLISLMKDQVDKLPPRIAGTATFVNSSLTAEESAARLERVATGDARLVYAAPERLRQAAFVEMLKTIGIGLVVVDEVHCVSMWGHDFRPDYLFIRHALEALGGPALLGMTATATPETALEIGKALGREPDIVRTTVIRPNLRYDVEAVANAEDRLRVLVQRLRGLRGGSAIVYARSRRSTEEVARVLCGHGLRAEHYHAGLDSDERTRVQDDFVADRTQVVVATTAFGMGIDKPDVRLVCLVNYPESLESYVQMVGRAGRDGEPSDTLLLASPSDAAALRRFAVSDVPAVHDLRAMYRALRGTPVIDPGELAGVVTEHDPRVLVGMLEQAGLVRRGFDEGRRLRVEVTSAPDDAGRRVDALLRRARLVAESRADRMVAFAERNDCRHAQVAEHFGEAFARPCGACDVCSPAPRAAGDVSEPAPPLPEDVAEAIVQAVASLRWPLGRRSLVAALRGSVQAPPSARRSAAYRLLAAASDADVRRWVQLLEVCGTLVETTTQDGYRVLVADTEAPRPTIRTGAPADVDDAVVERLRRWRLERSHEDGVPAYVVLHDATLRELAAVKPRTHVELAGVKGFGPVKVERYGDDLLAVLGA
jgi:ATP-dependent DNA helicase RecQ